jgi:hypothetical protein
MWMPFINIPIHYSNLIYIWYDMISSTFYFLLWFSFSKRVNLSRAPPNLNTAHIQVPSTINYLDRWMIFYFLFSTLIFIFKSADQSYAPPTGTDLDTNHTWVQLSITLIDEWFSTFYFLLWFSFSKRVNLSRAPQPQHCYYFIRSWPINYLDRWMIFYFLFSTLIFILGKCWPITSTPQPQHY